MRFKHVIPRLPVADLRRTIDFYEQLLGFQIDIIWPDDSPTFCILQRGGVSIGFWTPNDCRPAAAIGVGELYMEVEDIIELHKTLREKVQIEWGPEVYFYGRREFAIRDTNGYLLIFTEPTDDPVTCPAD